MADKIGIRRGRPHLQSEKKRLPTLGFRPTPGVRRNIDDAAKKNGRSLSQEIESRLEQSFLQDIAQRSTFGADHIHGLAILVATAARLTEAETKRSWRDDRPTLDALRQAIDQILDVFGPAQIRGAETRDAFDAAVNRARDVLGQILRP